MINRIAAVCPTFENQGCQKAASLTLGDARPSAISLAEGSAGHFERPLWQRMMHKKHDPRQGHAHAALSDLGGWRPALLRPKKKGYVQDLLHVPYLLSTTYDYTIYYIYIYIRMQATSTSRRTTLMPQRHNTIGFFLSQPTWATWRTASFTCMKHGYPRADRCTCLW